MQPVADSAEETPLIEGYDVLDVIGRGGMGVVYEAVQRSTGKRVAIKFTSGASEALRRRFEREVDLVARLDHPNIVRLLDSGVQRGQYYFVMEFVDGAPLDTVWAAGEAPLRECLELVAQVCDAVDYAHQRGVLHRDLKPANILITESGRVPKILDFGLAKGIDPRTGRWQDVTLSEPGQLLGTLGYMAPEQARGDSGLTSVRTDVYALGAILYEMLSGTLPCAVFGPLTEVLNRIAQQEPAALSRVRKKIPRDVDALVGKALAKEPVKRYATAGEMAADMRRFLRHEPVLARPTAWGVRAARWVRRNRAISAISATAAIGLISLAIYSFVRISAENRSALKNLAIAQGKLRLTLSAFDRVAFDLDRALGDVLGTEQIRRDVFETAKEFYESLPQDAALLGLESVAGPQYGRIGDVLREREDFDLARRFYDLSLRAAQTAAAKSPGGAAERLNLARALAREASLETDPRRAVAILQDAARASTPAKAEDDAIIHEHAEILLLLANRLVDSNRCDAAQDALRRAIELAQRGAAGDAKPAEDALKLAAAYRQTVQIMARVVQVETEAEHDPNATIIAIRSYSRAAQEHAVRMVQAYSDRQDVLIERLRTANDCAAQLALLGLLDDADEILNTARTAADEIVGNHPGDFRLRLAAAAVYSYTGVVAYDREDWQRTIDWTQRANAIIRPAFELQPNDLRYRGAFAKNLAAIANAQHDAGLLPDATTTYKEFLTISEPLFAENTEHVIMRAYAWQMLGEMAPDPTAAAEYFQRGLADLARRAARQSLDSFELDRQAQLNAALAGVQKTPPPDSRPAPANPAPG